VAQLRAIRPRRAPWPCRPRQLLDADKEGIIRSEQFGDGRYEQSEREIQQLLGIEREPVGVEGVGVEADADWARLGSPQTHVGYRRSERFASPGGAAPNKRRGYELPKRLRSNQWALSGEWTIGYEKVMLEDAGGSIVYRFDTRDAHLVLSARAHREIPFSARLDGDAPGLSHGVDVDEAGRACCGMAVSTNSSASRSSPANAGSRSAFSSPEPKRSRSRSASGPSERD
jgi:hypothetical protein